MPSAPPLVPFPGPPAPWTGPPGPPGPAGPPGPPGPSAVGATAHEEFLPANGATTVTVSLSLVHVLTVARGGVVQSAADGHYTVSSSTLTFSTAFDGTERVVISYQT